MDIFLKKLSLITLCCLWLFSFIKTTNASVIIDYDHAIASDGTLTTPYSFAIVETFNSVLGVPVSVDSATGLDQNWTWFGNGAVVIGSESGAYAAPGQTDTTNFLTIPEEDASPLSVVVDFGGNSYNYLGLYWGSVDAYNEINFLSEGNVISTWTGTTAMSPSQANGNQTAPGSNLYVNFEFQDEYFDSVMFSSYADGFGGSAPFAFELDNLAVGIVPLPATILLGIIGLGVGGWKLRK
jgi:hypothetical protein